MRQTGRRAGRQAGRLCRCLLACDDEQVESGWAAGSPVVYEIKYLYLMERQTGVEVADESDLGLDDRFNRAE